MRFVREIKAFRAKCHHQRMMRCSSHPSALSTGSHNFADNPTAQLLQANAIILGTQSLIEVEKEMVEHMLASLSTSSLQNPTTPTRHQVAHHFWLACKKAGFAGTEKSMMRILKRLLHKIRKAQSVLELVNRREGQPQ